MAGSGNSRNSVANVIGAGCFVAQGVETSIGAQDIGVKIDECCRKETNPRGDSISKNKQGRGGLPYWTRGMCLNMGAPICRRTC